MSAMLIRTSFYVRNAYARNFHVRDACATIFHVWWFTGKVEAQTHLFDLASLKPSSFEQVFCVQQTRKILHMPFVVARTRLAQTSKA